MTKLTAFMKDLDVEYVSLVDKGANKRKFELYKSKDGKAAPVEAGCGPANKKDMKKFDCFGGLGSSFKGAIEAIETQEQLIENQCKVDESFWVLKAVMQGVLQDDSIKDKSASLEKAIQEFSSYVTDLFKGLPVQKAHELLNSPTGGDMDPKTKAELEKAKNATGTQKEGGVSSNGEPAAQNRQGDQTNVAGISKKKNAMKKKMTAEALEKAKSKLAELEKAGAHKDALKKAEFDEAFEEVTILTDELAELEKAVGDRSEGAPATGEDTVAKNGDAATAGQTNNAATGDTAGNVAKNADGTPVKKDVAGTEDPTMSSAQNQNVKHDVSLAGAIGPIVEEFKKTMEVTLDGKLGGMTDLIKNLETKVNGLETKVAKSEQVADKVTKAMSMGGLSNSLDSDFEESPETTKKRDEVNKSESDVWKGATDGFGGLRGDKKTNTK